MINVPVPEDFVEQLKEAATLIIGPPPGVSREHCIEAQACVTPDWKDDGMGLGFTMFFKPDDNELEHLNNGGLLKVQIRGNGLVPHSLGTW